MRDHPDTPAGKARGVALVERHVTRALKEEELLLGRHSPAEPGTVPVAMPYSRFRREFFGGDGYQCLNDQRTRLDAFDIMLLEQIDGARTISEIYDNLSRVPGISVTLESTLHAIERLVKGGLLRWSTVRCPGRPVKIEVHERQSDVFDRLSSPINVLWEPTLHCNLSCDFCYNASGPSGDRGERRTDAVKQFADSGALQLTLIGGEPMMLPDFYDLVHQAEGLGMSTEFVTNGWFIDEKHIARLLETNIFQLVISIDGLEATHDRLRGKQGSYKRAMRGVRLLADAGFDVNVTVCLQRSNVSEIEPLIDTLAEGGAARVKLRPMVAEGRARSIFSGSGLTLAEIERYQPVIKRKKEEYRGRMSVAHRMPATQLGVCACDYNPENPGVIARYKGTCGMGRLQCYVRVDGGVTPNSTLRDHVLGNIYERSFKEIWQDESLWTEARPPNRAGLKVLHF
ncbi:radical SAM protein [Sorangium sp. So ce281]|uniref:radical SAM/SPASM domain-containing protein n=1 Tax=unclassified Sorangium TaxID=2621164 RepID=UPI003F602F52